MNSPAMKREAVTKEEASQDGFFNKWLDSNPGGGPDKTDWKRTKGIF